LRSDVTRKALTGKKRSEKETKEQALFEGGKSGDETRINFIGSSGGGGY